MAKLNKRHEYLRIQRKGSRIPGSFLILIALPLRFSAQKPCIGLTVPKTVGKAHVRNLVKRRLRHIVFLHESKLQRFDVVILAKPKSATASFLDLEQEFVRLLSKITSTRRSSR